MRILFQAQFVCRRERGPNFWLNCYFSRKRNVYIYITTLCQFKWWKYCFQMRGKISKFFWRHGSLLTSPPPLSPPSIFETNQTISKRFALLRVFPIRNLFLIIDQCRFYFTSGIDPVILMKEFEDYIIFFIWEACFLFNFYLKQKQRFLVCSFTENAFFISFHEGIWSITKAH